MPPLNAPVLLMHSIYGQIQRIYARSADMVCAVSAKQTRCGLRSADTAHAVSETVARSSGTLCLRYSTLLVIGIEVETGPKFSMPKNS